MSEEILSKRWWVANGRASIARYAKNGEQSHLNQRLLRETQYQKNKNKKN